MIALIAFLVAAILGVVIWLLALACSPSGQHARPHEGRHEFANPADRTDPYGDNRPPRLPECGLLEPLPDPDWLDEDELDAGWWAQSAPPGRVEVLPPLPRRQPVPRLDVPPRWTPPPAGTLRDVLAALQGPGTGDGSSEPRFTPAPGCGPADDDPDTTGVFPHAVGTWGKTAEQVAADLASKYLTAEVPQ